MRERDLPDRFRSTCFALRGCGSPAEDAVVSAHQARWRIGGRHTDIAVSNVTMGISKAVTRLFLLLIKRKIHAHED